MSSKRALSLAGKVILVTRPQAQSETLCHLLEAQGATIIAFPAIEITTTESYGSFIADQCSIEEFDLLLFVSRNAVTHAFNTIINQSTNLKSENMIAIGTGTAAELANLGFENVLHAGFDANSEALLELPELQAAQIDSYKILVVKGEGGRNLLVDELSRRGASVTTANVYKRIMPEYDKDYVRQLWKKYRPDIVVVTSNEGLANLVKLTPETEHERLFNSILLVLGQRAAEMAVQLGFINRIIIAREKSDEGLVQALCEIDGE